MKNENYMYLHNLNLKVRRFESFNMPTILERLYADEIEEYRKKQKEIQLEENELKTELKEALNSFIQKLKTEKYPYYSNEYDTIIQVSREMASLDNELDKISLKVPKKKLAFDGDKFMNFLSKYTGTNISYMKNFFGTAINDLIKEMNEFYEYNDFNFHNYIKGTLPKYLPNLNYIENKYNANVNCFKSTGKYIQDIDKILFENNHPEIYFYYEYAKAVGFLDNEDVYEIQSERSVDKSFTLESDGKEPYTPEEYCYAMFYKNSRDFNNKMLCTNYIKNGFEKAYLNNGILIPLYDEFIPLIKKININTSNPKKFGEIIENIINFYILHLDRDGSPKHILEENGEERYDKAKKEFVEKINASLLLSNKEEKFKSSVYVDENNQNFSNNNPDYPGSGDGGKGSM